MGGMGSESSPRMIALQARLEKAGNVANCTRTRESPTIPFPNAVAVFHSPVANPPFVLRLLSCRRRVGGRRIWR